MLHYKQILPLLITLSLTTTLYSFSSDEELLSMSLDELLQVEIVSSTNKEESIYSVPSSVSLFTYEQIDKMGVDSLEDLMNYVPGFQANRGDVYTDQKTAYIRGRYTNAGQKNILILLDGQRLNSDWGGGALSSNRQISLENIARVEFIRGPGSALYGSGAFLGVINLYSKKDLNNVGLRVRSEAINGYANLSYKGDEFSVNLFAKGTEDKGQEYKEQLDLYTDKLRKPKDINNGSELYLNAAYKNFSFQARYQERNTEGWYLLALNSDQSRSQVSHSFIRANYVYDAISNYTTKLSLSYLHTSEKAKLAGSPNVSTAKIKENEFSLEWKNDYKINSTNNLYFGVDYRHPKLTQADVVLIENVSPTESLATLTERDIVGIYGQYQGAIGDVTYTLGARYDKYSDFGETFNPRVALVYQALESTSLKLLYGSAFRAPMYNELYYSSITGEVAGNPNLEPESVDTYEAILVQKIFSTVLTLSYFYTQVDNAIVQVRNSVELLSSENVGSQNYSGLEFESISEFFDKTLYLHLGATHILGSDEDVRVTPDTTLSTILNYRYNKLNINLSGYYHSQAENDYETYIKTLDAYTVIDSKITYTFNKNFMTYIEVKNLLDSEYYTPSPSPSATTGTTSTARAFDVENRGRLAYLGLRYSF